MPLGTFCNVPKHIVKPITTTPTTFCTAFANLLPALSSPLIGCAAVVRSILGSKSRYSTIGFAREVPHPPGTKRRGSTGGASVYAGSSGRAWIFLSWADREEEYTEVARALEVVKSWALEWCIRSREHMWVKKSDASPGAGIREEWMNESDESSLSIG